MVNRFKTNSWGFGSLIIFVRKFVEVCWALKWSKNYNFLTYCVCVMHYWYFLTSKCKSFAIFCTCCFQAILLIFFVHYSWTSKQVQWGFVGAAFVPWHWNQGPCTWQQHSYIIAVRLLCCVVFWLYANVPEEYTASLFRAKGRTVGKWLVYIGLEGSGSV